MEILGRLPTENILDDMYTPMLPVLIQTHAQHLI